MKLICIQIDDTETKVEKEFRSFKALKCWLATMPGLFPESTRKKWLELTKSHFDGIPDEGVLFITLTPAGTVYSFPPSRAG